jgi:hypothetical protein
MLAFELNEELIIQYIESFVLFCMGARRPAGA